MIKESNDRILSNDKAFLESVGLPAGLVEYLSKPYGNIKMTDETKAAIEKIAKLAFGELILPAFNDGEIIYRVLSTLMDEKAAYEKTEALLNRFHSLLGIFSADAEYIAALGLSLAATIRLLMLSSICLWDGKANIFIKNGRDSAKYFGEIYRAGKSDHAVGFIDDDFCLIETTELAGDDDIVSRAKALNAKYVICSTVVSDSNNAPSGELQKAKALSEKLDGVGAKLLDRYIFFPNGRATLGLTPFSDELKYSFEHKNLERDKRGS